MITLFKAVQPKNPVCREFSDPKLETTLRKYQLNALKWMFLRETNLEQAPEYFQNILQRFTSIITLGDKNACFFNSITLT